jgi:hypothetical protein
MAAPGTVNLEGLLLPTWKNLFYPPEEGEYTYFAHAAKHPFTEPRAPGAAFSAAKAAWAADAAMLAYGRFGQQAMPESRFRSILSNAGLTDCTFLGDWSATGHGTQGFFAGNNEFAILAFRGSERDDPADSLTDIDFRPSQERDFTAAQPPPSHSLLHMLEDGVETLMNGCVVHHGFQQALNQVWDQTKGLLDSYRSAHSTAEICFTGHSLGAALATLAVSRFAGRNASLYTIGSPRVGNAAFCGRVHDRATLGAFRFVDNNDLVTHVPIQMPLYEHVENQCYRFDDHGRLTPTNFGALSDFKDLADIIAELAERWKFQELNQPAPSRLVDHSPARYCIRLRNYLAASSTASGQRSVASGAA